jgi:hypothetical protein
MTVKKVTLDDASKHFQLAQSQAQRIAVDQTDPIYNLTAALHNYIVSVGTAQNKLADGVNDALERLDRIESLLKAQGGQRRP